MAGPARAWSAERSIAGPYNPILIAMVVTISSFMEVLDSSIANVALANIAGNLSASYEEATWVLTSYMIANAIVIPMSAFLSSVIGRKRYYMMSVALFTGASLLCGMAPNLRVLIAARVLQGIGGGGLAPVVQSMLADTFPLERRGQAFGLFGITIILGPIIGPTLGGWITDNYSWHWIFLINVPVGLLSLTLVSRFVTETGVLVRERAARLARGVRIDYIGIALLALGLGALQITCDKGQELDWFSSTFIRTSAVVAAVCLVVAVAWELTHDHPVIDLRLFKKRNFAVANLLFAVLGIILFGTTQFLPELLQEQLHYTATQAGMAMAVGGLATAVMMPVAGNLSGRMPILVSLLFGLAAMDLSLWAMAGISLDLTFAHASWLRALQALGMPFIFVTLNTTAYVGIPGQKSGDAAAILNVVRNLGGGIGISAIQSILAQRQQVHHAHLVEHIASTAHPYLAHMHAIGATLAGRGLGPAAAGAGIGVIGAQIDQQAAILSFIDIFWLMAWFTILTAPLVLLLRRPRAGGPLPAGH